MKPDEMALDLDIDKMTIWIHKTSWNIKSGRPQTCDILNYAYKHAHCAPFKIVDIDVDVDVDDVDVDVDPPL